MFAGSALASQMLPDYEIPSIPVSILAAIVAGPIEETIFFGIPFYLFGNTFAVLGMGVLWAIIHVLNTDVIDVNHLAYGGFLFAIPHIFFSLRTWISKKRLVCNCISFCMECYIFVFILCSRSTGVCSV